MKKVKLVSLGLLSQPEIVKLNIGDAEIEVKSFLPYEEVLDMIGWTVNKMVDGRGYVSEPVKSIIQEIAVCKYYTNLDFDEIDSADFVQGKLYEMYDFIAQHDIYDLIVSRIERKQIEFYERTSTATIESLIAYRNSAAGIIEVINAQGKDTNEGIKEALATLGNKEEFAEVFRMMEVTQPQPKVPAELRETVRQATIPGLDLVIPE